MTAAASAPLLQVDDLHFRWPAKTSSVLDGINLTVSSPEVISLLGANGCGKSTLLRLLLGFLKPASGRIRLLGRDYQHWSKRELAQHIAYVPQSQQIPFPYRVRELVAMGRIPARGLYRNFSWQDNNIVAESLQRLGISHLSEQIYSELSGGQQQLCLIARALTQQPTLLLLDEPVTGLDYGNQWRLLKLIRQLGHDGVTVIKTSHYPEHAVGVADRVLLLEQGHIHADGLPEEVITARSLYRLYQLHVDIHAMPDGRLAFIPELNSHS